MTSLVRFVEYDKWANDRVLGYLGRMDEQSTACLQIVDHILFAQEVWLARIKGRRYEAAQKSRSLSDYAAAFQKCYDEYLEFLSWLDLDELDSVIEYTDTKGNPYSNSLHDIILHVCNHGSYHRGQIALRTREAGAVPLSTDYILKQREAQD